jgi:acetyl esterase/lipase
VKSHHLSVIFMLAVLAFLPVAAIAQQATPEAATPGTAEEEWPQIERNIAYGQDDPNRQFFHVYRLPPREAPRPALVLFHGGSWVSGSPDEVTFAADAFSDQGLVVFNASYRFFDEISGENPWPTQLDDAQRAIRWIRAHADDYNVDPDRVCALGWSAGGTLAALLGTTDTRDNSDPALADYSSRVACVVSMAGPVDFTKFPAEPDQFFERWLGGTLIDDRGVYQDASAVLHVDESTVPFLILHGRVDSLVPVQQSRDFVSALTSQGIEVVYAELPDAGHMDLFF